MPKIDEITRLRNIAEPLAKKHLWYDITQSELDSLFERCRSYADKLERVKRIAPDEAFQERYQAIIDELNVEIAWDWEQYQCYDRNNLQRDGKNPWEGNYRSKLFINGTILSYLESIFSDHPKGKEQGPPEGEAPALAVTFEGLFSDPSVSALVIKAMQEAEPKPLLNVGEDSILSGKSKVAPVIALVDALFHRKLIKGGIAENEAYRAICSRFGFPVSDRPDKARNDGEGIYKDYKEEFLLFFLSNRLE